MYTDERFCIPCYNNGYFNDGDNFCTKCQSYLCLTCAKGHGLKCGNEAFNNKFEQHIHFLNDPDANIKKPDQNRFGCKDLPVKKENTSYKPPVNIECPYAKDPVSSNSTYLSAKDSKRLDDTHESHCRNQEQISGNGRTVRAPTDKNAKQTYSARKGAVRVTKLYSHEVSEKLHRCYNHPEMIIENFCVSHGDLCCEFCLNARHNKCIIQPIDEVAHDIYKSGMVEILEHEFEIAKVKVTGMVKECEIRLKSKRQSKRQFERKKKLDQAAVKMENIGRLKTKCNELYENISISLAEIKNAKESDSEVFTFIAIKKNEHMLKHAKDKIAGLLDWCEIFVPEDKTGVKQATGNGKIKDNNIENKVRECFINENEDTNACAKSRVVTSDVINKRVIGDIVLHPFETDTTMESVNQYNNEGMEIQTLDMLMQEEYDVEKEKEKQSEKQNKNNANTSLSEAKTVNFIGKPVTGNVTGMSPKHRVKTYGLTTEYYMTNDGSDDLGEIRILRLQSAPPERTATESTDTCNRANSAYGLKTQGMFSGNDYRSKTKSGLNQIDTYGVTDEKNEQSKSTTRVPISEQTRNKRTTYTAMYEAKTKLSEQNQTYRKKHDRKREKQSVPMKKKRQILCKKRPDESKLISIIKSHESRGEEHRLKQWIKHTEEMSKLYSNRNTTSKDAADNDNLEPDKNVIESDDNDYDECDSCDTEKVVSTVPLTTKEASVIQVINPDDRQYSAKSRTSESEEAHYINQSYAHPPRTQLVLSKEQIIRIPDDIRVCEINSIACMPDGRILVSDFSNMDLKMVYFENGDIRHLKLEDPPHGITAISNSIAAAITGLAYDALLIISVGQTLTIKRHFKTDCVCKAIDSYESHIYLLCLYRYRTEVRIVSIDGVTSIRFNLGHAVSSPKGIAINELNGLIYIIDQNRGLFTVERCGKIIARCFDKNIEQYNSVEVDLNNNIFVSTKNPCGIYELDYDGRHLLPIFIGYGAEIVKAFAYDVANNALVVGCTNSETIQIYKIHNSLAWREK